MCQEWMDSYEIFYEWAMANGYDQGLEIDRINNDLGYFPENCRFVTSKDNCRNRNTSRIETGFGETKTLAEWCEDHRCLLSYGTVVHRLEMGWGLEEAITTPARSKPLHHVNISTSKEQLFTGFGESKTAKDWSLDNRCQTTENNLRQRLYKGMSVEEALMRPEKDLVTAFGKSLTTGEWVNEPECKVSQKLLRARVRAGWDPEEAMTDDPGRSVLITAFGETKLANEWVKDQRAAASSRLICKRIRDGWPTEEAIATPAGKPDRTKRKMTASDKVTRHEGFGEIKTAREWSSDPRCQVTDKTLRGRIGLGWSIEDAITVPVGQRRPSNGDAQMTTLDGFNSQTVRAIFQEESDESFWTNQIINLKELLQRPNQIPALKERLEQAVADAERELEAAKSRQERR